ncbi:hypothetical protein [Nonomuraea basaltis]|uniref:hypothetical protein n=1 Tax=Nonomuraea basaltis TaxID=2495887 RepID=UPI00198266F2|nr:hypothetical protein [Nonomuraea basaltis]
MTMHDLQDDDAGDGPRADRPRRRYFTADYKLRILEEYDAATTSGAKGALLRREGLYDGSIARWRSKRDAGELRPSGRSAGTASAKIPRERSVEKVAAARAARLEKENARLVEKLAKTEAALEVVGKLHALLEMISKSADSENS